MSVIDYIEKLQKKPLHVRVRIMWGGVTLCMAAIIFLWFWSLDLNMAASSKAAKNGSEFSENWEQIKKDAPTLWQSLGAGISNIMKGVQQEDDQSASQSEEPMATGEPLNSPAPVASSLPDSLPVE